MPTYWRWLRRHRETSLGLTPFGRLRDLERPALRSSTAAGSRNLRDSESSVISALLYGDTYKSYLILLRKKVKDFPFTLLYFSLLTVQCLLRLNGSLVFIFLPIVISILLPYLNPFPISYFPHLLLCILHNQILNPY